MPPGPWSQRTIRVGMLPPEEDEEEEKLDDKELEKEVVATLAALWRWRARTKVLHENGASVERATDEPEPDQVVVVMDENAKEHLRRHFEQSDGS